MLDEIPGNCMDYESMVHRSRELRHICKELDVEDVLRKKASTHYGNCSYCFSIGRLGEDCSRGACENLLGCLIKSFHGFEEKNFINPWLIHYTLCKGHVKSKAQEDYWLRGNRCLRSNVNDVEEVLPITGDDQVNGFDESMAHNFKLLWACYVHKNDRIFHLKHVMNEAVTMNEIFLTAIETMGDLYNRLLRDNKMANFNASDYLVGLFGSRISQEEHGEKVEDEDDDDFETTSENKKRKIDPSQRPCIGK